MNKIAVILILLICGYNELNAQIYFQENDTLDHEINPNTSELVLAKYLKSIKAKNIVFSEEVPNYYKIQWKNGKWKLLILDSGEGISVNDKPYDEVFLPSKVYSNADLSLAKHKGKFGFLDLGQWGEPFKTEFIYDSIILLNSEEIERIKEYNKTHIENEDFGLTKPIPAPEFAAKKKGFWGKIILGIEGEIFVGEPFIYTRKENIPTTKWDQMYQLPYLQKLYEKHNIDSALPFPQELVYVKAFSSKTKKWGLYGGEGTFEELIKPAYDSIIGHKYPIVYEVWNDNKVGYYNENFELLVEPTFEKFEYVHLDHTYGCALYSKGTWQLYDAYENRLLVNGQAKTIEGLIELWLNRH